MKALREIIVKDYIITVGKYKGSRMSEIAVKDIQYLQWFNTNVERLPEEYYQKVREYEKRERYLGEVRESRSWI